MKPYKTFFYFLVFMVLSACDKTTTNIQEDENFFFKDDFETQNTIIDELFATDDSRWSNIQRSNPLNKTNEISIVTTPVLKGQNSLKIHAFQSNSNLSKMDIEKGGFKAYAGDKVIIKAAFFINSTASIKDLFLIDLESCSCWDPNVAANPSIDGDNKCPGIRLKMSGGNDYLSIERGKISGSTIEQTTFVFPRNQWVNVQWELTLSDHEDGMNRLLINGEEVLSENAMNMPNAQIFRTVFANEGINFTLQEPVFYERVQIGATAHPTSGDIELFVDDFSILVIKR